MDSWINIFQELAKTKEPSLEEALGVLRRTHPQHAKTIARTIFADSMVPRLGNKRAYEARIKNPGSKNEIHAKIDANSFGEINKLHGFEQGDNAIKKLGNHIADTSRMFGGRASRIGGDEFHVSFRKPEHARGFAKELTSRLAKEPKIGGTHNLAAAIGFGASPEHAENSLIAAKGKLGPTVNGKRQNSYSVGNAPSVIHDEHLNDLMTKPKDMKNPLEEPKMAIKPISAVPKVNAVA